MQKFKIFKKYVNNLLLSTDILHNTGGEGEEEEDKTTHNRRATESMKKTNLVT